MRTKNFLIASGVLAVGIIIYKLLFGFILPIVLFVSLGSILKILLKGSDENIETDSTEVLKETSISLSDDDVVEVEPMVGSKNGYSSENSNIDEIHTNDPSENSNIDEIHTNDSSENLDIDQNNTNDPSESLNIDENNTNDPSDSANTDKN